MSILDLLFGLFALFGGGTAGGGFAQVVESFVEAVFTLFGLS